MKKFMICLFVVSMLALPIYAMADGEDPTPTPTITPTTAVVDVKGYGNQFADYSTGCLDIYSVTTTTSYGTAIDWTAFNNVVGDISYDTGCIGPGCGMNLTQGSITETNFNTTTETILDGVNLVGAADMTTLGGLAACSTPGLDGFTIPLSGSLFQTHSVNNTVTGTVVPGVTGTASYTGTQTLDLKVGW